MKSNHYILLIIFLLPLLVPTVGMANDKTYNFNFIDEDIHIVLHTLAKISDVDIIIDDSVKGNVTMKLNNVTFPTALDVITTSKGLSYHKIGTSIVIESADMGKTEVTKLRYVRAIDIKKSLETITTALKVKMEIDDISNSIIITGPPAGCARIDEILKYIDVFQQQVSLEAKVVAINKTDMKDLGVDWKWDMTPQSATHQREQFSTIVPLYNADGSPKLDSSGNQATTNVETNTWKVTRQSNTGILQFGRNPEGWPYEFYYQAKINALLNKGDAKILASPKVTTINGKEARVLIGERIPILTEKTENGKTSTTTEYIDTGIKLIYTPSITTDHTITAKVRTEVSTPTLVADIKNYQISTREAESTVLMKDGETIVIAGLIGSVDSKSSNTVPFFSELPLLGALFKSVHHSKTETEVVIFLTANIIK